MNEFDAQLLTACAIRGHHDELETILEAHSQTLPLTVLMPLRAAVSSLRQSSYAFAAELKVGVTDARH